MRYAIIINHQLFFAQKQKKIGKTIVFPVMLFLKSWEINSGFRFSVND